MQDGISLQHDSGAAKLHERGLGGGSCDTGGQGKQHSSREAFRRRVQCRGAHAMVGGDPDDVDR